MVKLYHDRVGFLGFFFINIYLMLIEPLVKCVECVVK